MNNPEFIDNRNGNTLLAALQSAIPDALANVSCANTSELALAEISIATAFMSPAGFGAVAERLEQATGVRLLLGAEPEPESRRTSRKPGEPPQAAFERREVAEGLKLLEAGLRRDRDRQPFSAETRRYLGRMAGMLRAGKLQTRRYERGFLHAKAFLLDNLQPQVRLLNRQVAGFIRAHPPIDTDLEKVNKALDILEAPWPRREEGLLREQFRDRAGAAVGRSLRLVEWILATGLERYAAPPPLPPIAEQDLRLVCWMAVTAD